MLEEFVACHDCDLIHRLGPHEEGTSGRCSRCGALLFNARKNSIERSLAFAVAGVVLFAVANSLPFLSFDMQGRVTQTTLLTGVRELFAEDMIALAGLVLVTAVVAPAMQLGLLLYVLLPLHLGGRPWRLPIFFRILRHIQPWSMMEVFLIAILVAVVKLSETAEIVPGVAIWCFAVLIFALAASTSALDPRAVWRRVEVAT